jgi:hypothetical protein
MRQEKPMRSAATTLLTLLAPTAVLACAGHGQSSYGTTTVLSAPMPVVVPMGVPSIAAEAADVHQRDPAEELAAAICRRERVCTERGATVTAGASPRAGAACVAGVRPSALATLSALDCSPAEARAGLKDCLAALSSDDCSVPVSSDPQLIPACRRETICRKGT